MAEKGKGERGSLREKLLHALDLPADTLPGGWMIEMRGRHEITVRGCGKILEYTPERIRLSLPHCILNVLGCRLCCIAYHADAVSVEGVIRQIMFEEEEK